jgi:uncharacterized membrane protein YuzA (DUF378 family)
MDELDYLDWASLVLVVVGAVNWGLVGLGQLTGAGADQYNLVYLIFNSFAGFPQIESVIYLLVGLAGLYQVYFGYQLYEE